MVVPSHPVKPQLSPWSDCSLGNDLLGSDSSAETYRNDTEEDQKMNQKYVYSQTKKTNKQKKNSLRRKNVPQKMIQTKEMGSPESVGYAELGSSLQQ